MGDKTFVWTPELVDKFLEARFENVWLFKKTKQPWKEFYNILLESGFPEEMTIDHVRKKWSYTFETYKIAKKTKNKSWKYYKQFEQHFGISEHLEKYSSWNNEWKLKLISSISETKQSKMDFHKMWSTVEKSLRMDDLPADCYVQDLKGLWRHITMIFQRKHRGKVRDGKGGADSWPLYKAMLTYYKKFEPSYLAWIESNSRSKFVEKKKANKSLNGFYNDRKESTEEFQWSKDLTESFIQIRLQNDWLFREKKWAWNHLKDIMAEEYDFPAVLTGRDLCKKWASLYSEYQRAKATNNKKWVYYTLFELYSGDGSMNPIIDWQEEWVYNLISSRTDLRHIFRSNKDQIEGWREVERKLRNIGIPIDHSLLNLSEIWEYLLKTFKWKEKFAKQGVLNEHWPYYDAVANFFNLEKQYFVDKTKEVRVEVEVMAVDEDTYEDDMKLLDLKQLLQVKPERESTGQCRSCFNEPGCVNVFQEKDGDGVELAYKLKLIGGIQVDQSDSLPSQICLNCANQLENAYKFRRKCQEIDRDLRNNCVGGRIKEEHNAKANNVVGEDMQDNGANNILMDTNGFLTKIDRKPNVKKGKNNKQNVIRKKRRHGKIIYRYWKICEICGKTTSNLIAHMDMHTAVKAYECDLCDKKFKYKSGLGLHRSTHNPTPKKTCEVCGKSFHVMALYRRHFAYHANERKFSCDICGKRFNSVEILKVHQRIHTDERPFPCPECGKTFRTAGCVSRHKRIVHKNLKSK